MLAAAVTGLVLSAAAMAGPAPETSISSGPEGPWASKTAKFRFSSSVGGSKFQCNLDETKWRACESPRKYRRLKQGAHTFAVRARKGDAVDETPATRAFTVDTKSPDTTIVDGPTGGDRGSDSRVHVLLDRARNVRVQARNRRLRGVRQPLHAGLGAPRRRPFPAREGRRRGGEQRSDPGLASLLRRAQDRPDARGRPGRSGVYFPDTVDFDVPANCGGTPSIDCPSGTPVPPVSTPTSRGSNTSPGFSRVSSPTPMCR